MSRVGEREGGGGGGSCTGREGGRGELHRKGGREGDIELGGGSYRKDGTL